MNDHFVVAQLKHAVALAALLSLIEKLQYRTQEERVLIAEALRRVADRVERCNVLIT